jgi:hypothetical protein
MVLTLLLAMSVAQASSDERTAQAAERTAAALERIAEALAASPAGPTTATKEAAAAKEKAKPRWTGVTGLNLISLTGNSETLTVSANLAAKYQWDPWALSLTANGAFGQARVDGAADMQVVALNGGVQVRGDRLLSQVTSLFLVGGLDTDHVKSVEVNGYAEGGVGVEWQKRKEPTYDKLLLRTDFAARYAYESRFQYYPVPVNVADVVLVAPRAGVAFLYALNAFVSFRQDAEVLLGLTGPTRVLVNSNTRFSSRLTDALSLAVGFLVRHDSAPAVGKKPTDTTLSAGLELTL